MVACIFFVQANAQDLQADNMLLFQRGSGGWSKQFKGKAFDYNTEFSKAIKSEIEAEAQKDDANIDNGSTTKEIRYLVTAYKKIRNPKYLAAAEKGIRYLLKSQYENGGWPQYYPDKHLYRAHITFNDNAMINVMNVLQDVALKQNDLEVVDAALVQPSVAAITKGIGCILQTQIRVNGKLTGWCQQHDETTLQPANARAYELVSISGFESVNIIKFLLSQPAPSKEMKDAIHAGVEWLQAVKLEGYKVAEVPAPGTEKGVDRQLVADQASTIWARFYEIGTNKPFFCDRDGIKKYSLKEIGYGRRNGYAWYGTWAKTLLDKEYPSWVRKNTAN